VVLVRHPSLILLALCAGCGGDPPGTITAEGLWADGEAIRFSEQARLTRTAQGRVEVRATSGGRPRFLGLRLTYDPAFVPAPGVYQVDPEPGGRLELYCLRPKESAPGSVSIDVIEYEVSAANVAFDRLPGPNGGPLEGSFDQVVLERRVDDQLQRILTLAQGRFRVP
jgi:hypothetical protein